MGAKLDHSLWSIVVWCSDCPTFSELASNTGHGYDVAVGHELSVHPGMKDAMSNRTHWRNNLALGVSRTQ